MEAWSGVAPFRRATPEECDDAMREPHPKPSDYDPRLIPLDDVIVRAMQLDPKQRQQDAADVARALRAFLQGTDVTDIARELGDRVRDLREAASEPMPMSLDGDARAQPERRRSRDEDVRGARRGDALVEPAGLGDRAARREHATAPREPSPRPGRCPRWAQRRWSSSSRLHSTPMGETPVALSTGVERPKRADAMRP